MFCALFVCFFLIYQYSDAATCGIFAPRAQAFENLQNYIFYFAFFVLGFVLSMFRLSISIAKGYGLRLRRLFCLTILTLIAIPFEGIAF